VLVIDKKGIPRVELYISSRDGGVNYGLYEFLKGQRVDIEKEFGKQLIWDEQEHLVSRRIMSQRANAVALDDISSHDELINWFMEEHKKFRKYILPRIDEYARHSHRS
jgi:hypothetical protein